MRIAAVAIFVTLLAGLLPLPVLAQPADWIEYSDAQHGFSLRYPPQWSPVNLGALAAFGVAEPELPGQFRRSVVVQKPVVVPAEITAEELQDVVDNAARNELAGYTIIKRETIDVGSVPGIIVYFTWTPAAGVRAYQLRLFLVVDGRVHVVVGTTLADSPTLDADLVLLLSIIATYRIAPRQ